MSIGTAFSRITGHDPIWRPNGFYRVTVSSHDAPEFSILATCYSEYRSGPNLVELADAAFEISGNAGHYGLRSCRAIA